MRLALPVNASESLPNIAYSQFDLLLLSKSILSTIKDGRKYEPDKTATD